MAKALEALKSSGAAAAEPLLRQALQVSGDSSEFKAMTYFNLGLVLYDLKRPLESEAAFIRAIELLQQLLPKQNELYGMFLKTMTEFYEKENRHADAGKYYLAEINLTREMYGSKHPYVANILNEYAGTLIVIRDFTEAEKNLVRALGIMIAARGPNNVQNGPIHANLAKCYVALGRAEDAAYHQDRADELEAKAQRQKRKLADQLEGGDIEGVSEQKLGESQP